MTSTKVTILGDGGGGTAISVVLADREHKPVMWGHDPAYLQEMRQTRVNRLFLPRSRMPDALEFEPDLARALAGAELVIVAIPTKYLRLSLANARGRVPARAGVVSFTKGIEAQTLKRPSEILRDMLGCDRVAVLSGPSHAEEVAERLPTTVTVAAADPDLAGEIQAALMTPAFRVYTSADILGVELGGALKNVIALAAGISIGLGLGDNALAALMTRGLAEITRLGVALGADAATFAGLSGLGDLTVTCLSPHSRNRAVGVELGRGRTLAAILAERQTVAEGVTTAASASALAQRTGVQMPITHEVAQILFCDKDPRQAVTALMTREGKAE